MKTELNFIDYVGHQYQNIKILHFTKRKLTLENETYLSNCQKSYTFVSVLKNK